MAVIFILTVAYSFLSVFEHVLLKTSL